MSGRLGAELPAWATLLTVIADGVSRHWRQGSSLYAAPGAAPECSHLVEVAAVGERSLALLEGQERRARAAAEEKKEEDEKDSTARLFLLVGGLAGWSGWLALALSRYFGGRAVARP